MPTSPLMQIPKSRSAEEFELVCTDILTNKNGTRFTPYGRKGQKQNGIDIYGKISDNNYIVAQCKNYFNEKSADRLIKKIKEDINALSQLPFYNDINKFMVMTSMDIDNKVQNEIEGIKSKFDIEVWFWEHIQVEICDDNNLLKRYYPQIFNFNVKTITVDELINDFNSLMREANILEFIQADPFIGMKDYLPFSVDIFNMKIKTKLNDSIILQNEEIFKAINEFISKLDNYSANIGSLMKPTGNGYYIVPKFYSINDREKIREDIKKRKLELNNIYSRINKNCSLFY